MLLIGLTGGIGTGKSEAARILHDLGAEVIGSDEAGHQVYRHGTVGWRQVVAEFGAAILRPDGEVDRARLGSIVFKDAGALKRLNAIVHPLIRSEVESRLQELRHGGGEVAVVEAPLLLEAGWEDMFDAIWVTVADDEQVIQRVKGRDRLDSEGVRARIRSQMSERERLARADVVIDNRGSIGDLRARVRSLWRQRLKISGRERQPK